MKLGIYPKLVSEACKRNKIKRLEFEILLFTSEREWVSQQDIYDNVPAAFVTTVYALSHLVELGFLKLVRKPSYKNSGRYIITPSTRLVIQWFYQKFNYLQPK